jgi:hypothetical protein
MVTNLDRKAIEAKLAGVRQAAQAARLPELAAIFERVEGQPGPQIAACVQQGLRWLADKPQHQRIAADLELVEMNLKNLK